MHFWNAPYLLCPTSRRVGIGWPPCVFPDACLADRLRLHEYSAVMGDVAPGAPP